MKHNKINGLNILTDYMPSAETVSLKLMVKTGSRNETETNGGISHFLEHMAFKGTKSRSATQIAEEFDMIGGNFNAYTSREKTVYYAKVLKDDLETSADILADILQNSVFAQEEIDKEKNVILEELAQTKDTPEDHIFDIFQEKMFPDQPIGKPIIGSEEFIKNVSHQDLVSYVSEHYNRNNIVVSCAGYFDENQLHSIIERKFSGFAVGESTLPQKALYVGGEHKITKDLEQVHIAIGFQGLSYIDEDFYTQQVLSVILGGGMSSRLFQEIREKRGLAYHISTFSISYFDCGTFAIYSSTNPTSVNELISATAEQFKISLDSIREEELVRAKAQVRANILMAQESSSARAERIAWNYTVFKRIIPISEIIEKINAITVYDLHRLLFKILSNQELPTVSAIGKLDGVMSYEDIREHFAVI